MEDLHESKLEDAYLCFLNDMAKIIGIDIKLQPTLEIVINDKQISDKSEITSTNGRYFFRDPKSYRQFYIPHAESPGVYFFFDNTGTAVYVGKSETQGGIGKRVSGHIGKFDGNDLPNLDFPTSTNVIVIPFVQAPWLTPAFESYLLENNTFQFNINLSQ